MDSILSADCPLDENSPFNEDGTLKDSVFNEDERYKCLLGKSILETGHVVLKQEKVIKFLNKFDPVWKKIKPVCHKVKMFIKKVVIKI